MSPGSKRDLRDARGGVLGPYLGELGLDDAAQPAVVGQDRLELGHRLAQLRHLVLELVASQACEAAQRHVEDVVRLDVAELERRGHEAVARRAAIL